MTEIEYVDDEASATVEQIHELLAEGEDGVVAVAVCSPAGLNFLTKALATQEELEEARQQLTGLLEHFDELVAAAAANSSANADA